MLDDREIQPQSSALNPPLPIAEDQTVRFKPNPLLTEIIRGAAAVCDKQGELAIFAKRFGYSEAMADLIYFVGKPGVVEGISAKLWTHTRWPHFLKRGLGKLIRRLIQRQPLLVVVSAFPADGNGHGGDLTGALLVYEYRVLGIYTRFFTTNDRTGKQCFVAASDAKPAVIKACMEALCGEGAKVVLLSIHREEGPTGDNLLSQLYNNGLRHMRSAVRERRRKSFLPLLATLDDTYTQLGRKTRKNLGYYRRLATKELGCTFEERVHLDKANFLTFNRRCMYAVPDDVASWRYERMSDLTSSFISGVKDRDDNWLCFIGCRRWVTTVEILWQMNLEGYRHLSLGVVARSFLIESEIALGTTRLQVEGGAAHTLYQSFVEEGILDVVLMRKTLTARMLRFVIRRAVQAGDELGLMLSHQDLD